MSRLYGWKRFCLFQAIHLDKDMMCGLLRVCSLFIVQYVCSINVAILFTNVVLTMAPTLFSFCHKLRKEPAFIVLKEFTALDIYLSHSTHQAFSFASCCAIPPHGIIQVL
jgi:hypothetical protein